MKGTMLVFKPGQSRPVVTPIDGPPTLELLKPALNGGYLEVVPHFRAIGHDGKQHACVALCDEDGKRNQLPFNPVATFLWDKAMRVATGVGCHPDYLVGPVVVVFGDDEFMEAM